MKVSLFFENSNKLAKKCRTTQVGPVHSSRVALLDVSREFEINSTGRITVLEYCYSRVI